MLPVNAREVGGALVLVLDDPASVNDGQTDLYRTSVYEALAGRSAPFVAVDLWPIPFLSSSGVAMLVGLRKRVMAAGGRLVLFGVHPHVADLLRMMKLAPLFPMADDEGRALALLRPASPG